MHHKIVREKKLDSKLSIQYDSRKDTKVLSAVSIERWLWVNFIALFQLSHVLQIC